MDWADDVAYSVHDLEDGIVAGLIPLEGIAARRDAVAELAASSYSTMPASELDTALRGLIEQAWWPASYDGSSAAQVALKHATSTLIGRFCRAAESQTRAVHGDGPLSRYDADLVVPEIARAECAVLKAITAVYVMNRPGVAAIQERERHVVADLVARLADLAPGPLEPPYAEAWKAAGSDAARLRVVVDQVAGLTDAAAAALHAQLV
jgi:dGTPase